MKNKKFIESLTYETKATDKLVLHYCSGDTDWKFLPANVNQNSSVTYLRNFYIHKPTVFFGK